MQNRSYNFFGWHIANYKGAQTNISVLVEDAIAEDIYVLLYFNPLSQKKASQALFLNGKQHRPEFVWSASNDFVTFHMDLQQRVIESLWHLHRNSFVWS